jgi:iron complex outermembrane recepter protein
MPAQGRLLSNSSCRRYPFRKNLIMKRTALFFCFFLFKLAVSAQTDTVVALEPVEVRSLRASKTAPFTRTNLTKTVIEKNNLGQDLPFLLNQTPSVVVNSDAGNGFGYTGIRIRGTDATRINVTLNGIPFNDPESGGTFFVDLPDFLSSTNSIQIQRGVGSSSNGAGAFGASINLSTNEINTKHYVELNNSYGSFNSFKNTLKFGTGLLGKHFTIDGRLSGITSDGYMERATSDLKSIYLSTAWMDTKNTFRLNAFSGKEKTYQAWNGVPEDSLGNHRRFNSAGTERTGKPYDNETDNYTQDHFQGFYTRKISSLLEANAGLFYIHGHGYYEQYKAQQKYSNYGLSDQTVGSTTFTKSDLVRQLWLDNDFVGGIFSLQRKTPANEITVGGAFTDYRGNHFGKVIWAEHGLSSNNRYYDHDAEKTDHNIYAKWDQKMAAHVRGYLDLQLRNTHHRIDGFKYNPTLIVDKEYWFFNPKAGLSFFKDLWSGYISYSIANREPNRDDFEAGNEQMPKPEQLQDVEMNIGWKNNTASFAVTAYYMNYRNQLALTGMINDVGAYTRTNIPESYRAGIELEGGTTLNSYLQLAANLTISRNKVKNFTEFLDDYDNGGQIKNVYKESDLAFSPSVIGAAMVTITPFKSVTIDLSGKYVGRQYLDNTGKSGRSLDAYYTQDLQAAWHFAKGPFKKIVIVGKVNNLFDKKYEPNGYTYSYFYNNELTTENFYFPMAGRNFVFGLNFKF